MVRDPLPPLSQPHIDPYHSSNMTALAGLSTRLNCRVYRLGNRTVSWLREEGLHLLTVGRYTYTSDLRYEASHLPHSADWSLTIKSVEPADSGQYLCQVSSTPIISHQVWLTVLKPSTNILGSPRLYVSLGSTINITCIINNAALVPSKVRRGGGGGVGHLTVSCSDLLASQLQPHLLLRAQARGLHDH